MTETKCVASQAPISGANVAFLSMCGHRFLGYPWMKSCIATFPRILATKPWHVLSDGTLTDQDFDTLESWAQCEVIRHRVSEESALEHLKPYPSLRYLREGNPIAKRLTDIQLCLPAETFIFSLDTDIFFRGELTLPKVLPRFAYCVDEVPGYGGSVAMCLCAPLLRALNGGVMLYHVDDLDLNWLEETTARYLMRSSDRFWIEQSIFGLLGGTIADASCFSPQQFDIISGLAKRSENKRIENRTTYFSGLANRRDPEKTVRHRIENASAIHFAGPGKPWIEYAASLPPKEKPETIAFAAAPIMALSERLLLATRLLAKESITRIRNRVSG